MFTKISKKKLFIKEIKYYIGYNKHIIIIKQIIVFTYLYIYHIPAIHLQTGLNYWMIISNPVKIMQTTLKR